MTRNWLSRLWGLTSPKIFSQQARNSGELMVWFQSENEQENPRRLSSKSLNIGEKKKEKKTWCLSSKAGGKKDFSLMQEVVFCSIQAFS